MSNLTALVLIDMAGNRLRGSLPADWASSAYLEYFSAQNNMLTGTIPLASLGSRSLGEPARLCTVVMQEATPLHVQFVSCISTKPETVQVLQHKVFCKLWVGNAINNLAAADKLFAC